MITLMVKFAQGHYEFADDIGLGLQREYLDTRDVENALIERANQITARPSIEFFIGLFDFGDTTERYKVEAQYTINGY